MRACFATLKARGLIAGEITPAYATLDEKVLRRIQRMNDKIKLIFVMRDPVERAWSAVNNAAKKGAADASTVEKSIEARPRVWSRGALGLCRHHQAA